MNDAPVLAASYEPAAVQILRAPRPRFRWGRFMLIAVAMAFLAAFLLLPLVVVFTQALSKGEIGRAHV